MRTIIAFCLQRPTSMQDPLMREAVNRLHVRRFAYGGCVCSHVVGVSATLMWWVCLLYTLMWWVCLLYTLMWWVCLLLSCGGCVCYILSCGGCVCYILSCGGCVCYILSCDGCVCYSHVVGVSATLM